MGVANPGRKPLLYTLCVLLSSPVLSNFLLQWNLPQMFTLFMEPYAVI